MSSDRLIRVSLGTAQVLGLADVPSDAPPTTAYLLTGGRCREACAFCAQARSSSARLDALSRVSWPAFSEGSALEAACAAWSRGTIQRACVQVTSGVAALDETERLATELRSRAPIPVCAAVYPRTLAQVERLLESGIEIVGFGLDAAAPRIYAEAKTPGHSIEHGESEWEKRLALAEEAAALHPGRVGLHLIAGLGETEMEMVRLIDRLARQSILVALFAFTPVRGTPLAHRPPPPLASYRRLQAVRHLLVNHHFTVERFTFSEPGNLIGYGLEPDTVRNLLADGSAFRTSGCPGCNRPYYNERPGRPLYNYPRPLSPTEAAQAIADLGL